MQTGPNAFFSRIPFQIATIIHENVLSFSSEKKYGENFHGFVWSCYVE